MESASKLIRQRYQIKISSTSLKQIVIPLEDYNHAIKVWNTLSVNNIGEYHDIYLATDVLHLADVIKSFRTLSYKAYALDCARAREFTSYLDTNALHSCAMTQPLPVSDFKWIDVKEEDLRYYYNTLDKGLVVAVYLKYQRKYTNYIGATF